MRICQRSAVHTSSSFRPHTHTQTGLKVDIAPEKLYNDNNN